ncbi:MAG: ferredoxin [Chloroflexi bacterium]|nr:ferredoxin [Chloroflexota bacterium]
MRAKVDRELCIGAANCVGIAPTVFKLDEDNKSVVLDPSSVPEKTLFEAAENCPSDAIILEDDSGRQIYP